MEEILLTRRITSPFISAIPKQVKEFDAYIYAVVKRKNGKDIPDNKFGTDVRIDPAIINLSKGTITVKIPFNINYGIDSIDDLEEHWYESLQAAFLALIYSCIS